MPIILAGVVGGLDVLPPTPLLSGLVIEGDSQTSTTPETYSSSFWSYQWVQNHTGVTPAVVVAQTSRTIGGPSWSGPPVEGADIGSPAGNTLLDHRPNDMARNAAALVVMIGSNDLGTFSVANFLSRLQAWAAPIRAAGTKVILITPPPYDSRHVNVSTFNARRLDYLTQIRANWASYVDALVPFGDHPDLNTGVDPHPLIADGVHLTGYDAVGGTGGQNRLYDCANAALESFFDATRIGATSPYPGDWFGAGPSVNAGAVVTRRYIVRGLGLGVVATCSLASSDGATMRRGFAAFGTSSFTVMNGDVIEVQVTASAVASATVSLTVTIGSLSDTLTVTTAADVPDIVPTYGGSLSSPGTGTVQSFSNVAFGAGVPVLMLTSYSTVGGTTDSGPTSVTLTPSGGGSAISLTKQIEQMRGTAVSRVIECWSHTSDIVAGNYDITITRPAPAVGTYVEYATLANADATPLTATGNTPAEPSVTSHSTPSVTIPAKGVALAAYFIEDTTSPTAVTVSDGTLLHQGTTPITGATVGIALAKRTTDGVVTFVNKTGTYARLIVVWGPAPAVASGPPILPPQISLVSGTAYPPQVAFDFTDPSQEIGDTVRLIGSASVDFATATLEATAVVPASGGMIFAGLAAIASPTKTYFRARLERGANISAWSNIVLHGETVAPTISSSATPSVAELATLAHTLIADQPIAQWAVVGGSDYAALEVEGSTLRFVGNGVADYEVKTSYTVAVRATNHAGLSSDQVVTLAISDVDEIPDSFAFTDQTEVPVNTQVASNVITIAGLAVGLTVTGSIAGAEFNRNGAGWQAAGATTFTNGTTLQLRMTSAAVDHMQVQATVTIAGVSDVWTVTTPVAASDMPQPAALGLYVRADDSARLFQTVTGTLAVADGDPVGTWRDKSAAAFDLTAPGNDDTRPIYYANGGLPYIQFDGDNDVLRRLAGMSLWTSSGYTAAIALRGLGVPASRYAFAAGNSGQQNTILSPFSSYTTAADDQVFMRSDAGATILQNWLKQNVFDGTDKVLIVRDDGSSVTLYVDGVAGTTRAYTRGSHAMTLDRIALGALVRNITSNHFPMRCTAFALWLGLGLSAGEMSTVLTNFAATQGRSL